MLVLLIDFDFLTGKLHYNNQHCGGGTKEQF